jgi:hypothetical protein
MRKYILAAAITLGVTPLHAQIATPYPDIQQQYDQIQRDFEQRQMNDAVQNKLGDIQNQLQEMNDRAFEQCQARQVYNPSLYCY